MSTVDTNLKDFVIKYSDDKDYIQQLNDVIQRLISNDLAVTVDSNLAPDIWQYRWREGQNGYSAGEAVWVNTDTVDDVVLNKQDEIIDFIQSRYELRQLCSNTGDVYDFYKKVVEGTAHQDIPRLFWLGDISCKAQIRVSIQDNNTSYPSSDLWEDFFKCDDESESLAKMLSCATDMAQRRLSIHMQQYHDAYASFDPSDYMVKSENAISDIPSSGLQQFSDHTYTSETRGIDFVKKQDFWRDSGTGARRWYRLWNSGYLEYGGIVFVEDSGARSFRVDFTDETVSDISGWPSFNYPLDGGKFYQTGYSSCPALGIDDADSDMKGNIRYSAEVSPMPQDSAAPYMQPLKNGRYYVSRDIFGMDNSGFSFVCSDGCSYYSYYASGFTTLI